MQIISEVIIISGSEDTHTFARCSPVSISQVEGLREKLRCVQLSASDHDAWGWEELMKKRTYRVLDGSYQPTIKTNRECIRRQPWFLRKDCDPLRSPQRSYDAPW